MVAVKWYVDGVEVAYDPDNQSWSGNWDSKSVPNGDHRIFSKASNPQGNWTTSDAQTITVNNK